MPHADRDQNNAYWRSYRRRKYAEGDSNYIEKVRARGRRAAKTRRERIRAIIRTAKDKPCTDCGNKYPPEIMDLDHVRGTKGFNVSKLINGARGYVSISRLEEEIAKCDPRCPTCHRLRHFHAGDWENLRRARTRRSAAA